MFERIEDLKRKTGSDRGFTLIELLVTVTIMGILAAVVSVGVGNATTSSQTGANKGTFNQVQASVDAYVAQAGNTFTTTVCGTAPACANPGYYDSDGEAGTGTTAFGAATDYYFVFASGTNPTGMRLHATPTLTCVFNAGTGVTATATNSTTLKGCKNS